MLERFLNKKVKRKKNPHGILEVQKHIHQTE